MIGDAIVDGIAAIAIVAAYFIGFRHGRRKSPSETIRTEGFSEGFIAGREVERDAAAREVLGNPARSHWFWLDKTLSRPRPLKPYRDAKRKARRDR